MASTPRLGKVQLQIMRLLWERKQATAREITDELARTQPIAHSTVQTLLRKMEAKGAVDHELIDRTFVFRPLYRQDEVTDTALRDLLSRLFDGSVYGLVSHLLKSEDVPDAELSRLRTLIDHEMIQEQLPPIESPKDRLKADGSKAGGLKQDGVKHDDFIRQASLEDKPLKGDPESGQEPRP